MGRFKCCCESIFKRKRRRKIAVLGVSDRAGSSSVALQIYFQQKVTSMPMNRTERWVISYSPSEEEESVVVRKRDSTSLAAANRSRKMVRPQDLDMAEEGTSLSPIASSSSTKDKSSARDEESTPISDSNKRVGISSLLSKERRASAPSATRGNEESKRSARSPATGNSKKRAEMEVELIDVGREDIAGGFGTMQPLLEDIDGLVFVLDSTEPVTEQIRNWIHGICMLPPRGKCRVFFVCNKQDQRGARSPLEIVTALGLGSSFRTPGGGGVSPATNSSPSSGLPSVLPYPEDTSWTCQPCVATYKNLHARSSIFQFIFDGLHRPMIDVMQQSDLLSSSSARQQVPPSRTVENSSTRRTSVLRSRSAEPGHQGPSGSPSLISDSPTTASLNMDDTCDLGGRGLGHVRTASHASSIASSTNTASQIASHTEGILHSTGAYLTAVQPQHQHSYPSNLGGSVDLDEVSLNDEERPEPPPHSGSNLICGKSSSLQKPPPDTILLQATDPPRSDTNSTPPSTPPHHPSEVSGHLPSQRKGRLGTGNSSAPHNSPLKVGGSSTMSLMKKFRGGGPLAFGTNATGRAGKGKSVQDREEDAEVASALILPSPAEDTGSIHHGSKRGGPSGGTTGVGGGECEPLKYGDGDEEDRQLPSELDNTHEQTALHPVERTSAFSLQ